MKLYNLDKREIRSFRLRYRTLELKNFFETKNNFGFFMMTDTIHPTDRIQSRKLFNEKDLKIINVSKKVSTFLTKNSEWHIIKNLLAGNVILIKAKQQTKPLTVDTIKFLLKDTNFNLRFLFWNENIYREKTLNTFIQKHNPNQLMLLTQLIKKIALTPLLLINPFLKRQN